MLKKLKSFETDTIMLNTTATIFTLLSLSFTAVLSGQKAFSIGPTVGFAQTNYGENENFRLKLAGTSDPLLGVSVRLFDYKWRLRTDVIYHTLSTSAAAERMINGAQNQLVETALEQSGLFVFAGAEYHLKPEGLRPFFGCGLVYATLLDYTYSEDVTTSFASGTTDTFSTLDDDTSGGEYGVYIGGGLTTDKLSVEIRFQAGNRNRSDFSIPVARLGILGTWLF